MEVAEIVRIGREMLKLMSENDVKLNDWKHLKMYEEYKRMRQNGVKYRYAITELAETYGISRANVERIVRRLGKDVK